MYPVYVSSALEYFSHISCKATVCVWSPQESLKYFSKRAQYPELTSKLYELKAINGSDRKWIRDLLGVLIQ